MVDDTAARPRRRRVLSPDEVKIWRAVVRDVKPLTGRSEDDGESLDPPISQPAEGGAVPHVVAPLPVVPRAPRQAPLPPLAAGRTPGVDKRTAQRMKKGDMEIDARLDLHGYTQDMAHAALTSFIGRAYAQGWRCVLLITGKGRDGEGVLRHQVPRWLNQSPLRNQVLGFSSARPQHGGEGALYVLVKRRRES